MAKGKPIQKVANLGKPFWIRLSERVIDMVYQNTVFKGKNVKGAAFKAYAESYKKEVQGGGNRPDLYKSGKMMLSHLSYPDSATDYNINTGWINPKSAQKVVWNEDMGRAIKKDTGFPYSRDVEKMQDSSIDKALDKKLKTVNSRVVINIGQGDMSKELREGDYCLVMINNRMRIAMFNGIGEDKGMNGNDWQGDSGSEWDVWMHEQVVWYLLLKDFKVKANGDTKEVTDVFY